MSEKIAIICIGDELLKGAVVNTNLSEIGVRLLSLGVVPPVQIGSESADVLGVRLGLPYVSHNNVEGVDLAGKTATEAAEAGANILTYGKFIGAIINFILIALIIFFVVKAINKLRRPKVEEPAKEPRLCPYCKQAIADDATRCPHCTSELPEETEAPEEA